MNVKNETKWHCNQRQYEKPIRCTDSFFDIEEYESVVVDAVKIAVGTDAEIAVEIAANIAVEIAAQMDVLIRQSETRAEILTQILPKIITNPN
ncbi:5501_t:CDS:2 [Scutellospora calospora]|uniref:5501_t:CDS:1 n=1 Tax=Scutellospora calospora TaxID=85575 RepID=A0ACA9K0W0_9GLOM|nr:5501_t:CDS:2 [Scutellospora calospora]